MAVNSEPLDPPLALFARGGVQGGPRSRPSWVCWCIGLLWAFAGLGCRSDGSTDPCEISAPNVPAFELAIHAQGLPFHQLYLDVRSGGGLEGYDLVSMCDAASSVDCFRASPGDLCQVHVDAGHDHVYGLGFLELTCDVWSDGAVKVNLSADGYVPYAVQLTPDRDDCDRIATQRSDVRFATSE